MDVKLTELRYETEPDDSLRLDEIVGTGFVHMEDAGDAWFVDVAGVRCSMFLRRKTLREWAEDVQWYSWRGWREWFCFHRIVLRANEVDVGPVLLSVDGELTQTVGTGSVHLP